jgi:hypothetical protein
MNQPLLLCISAGSSITLHVLFYALCAHALYVYFLAFAFVSLTCSEGLAASLAQQGRFNEAETVTRQALVLHEAALAGTDVKVLLCNVTKPGSM